MNCEGVGKVRRNPVEEECCKGLLMGEATAAVTYLHFSEVLKRLKYL